MAVLRRGVDHPRDDLPGVGYGQGTRTGDDGEFDGVKHARRAQIVGSGSAPADFRHRFSVCVFEHEDLRRCRPVPETLPSLAASAAGRGDVDPGRDVGQSATQFGCSAPFGSSAQNAVDHVQARPGLLGEAGIPAGPSASSTACRAAAAVIPASR